MQKNSCGCRFVRIKNVALSKKVCNRARPIFAAQKRAIGDAKVGFCAFPEYNYLHEQIVFIKIIRDTNTVMKSWDIDIKTSLAPITKLFL